MSQLAEARVVIAVPLAGPMIYWRTVAAILEMEKPAETDLMVFQGALIDRARNCLVERMLEHPLDPTHLFFLDSDIIPAADTLTRLLAHRQPIVSGLYRRRVSPYEFMAFLKTARGITHPLTPSLTLREGEKRNPPLNVRGGSRDKSHSRKGALCRVDYVGAGCLLIERRVFEKIRPAWFQTLSTAKRHLPEDFSFCEKARRAGYTIRVDTTVRPLHLEPMGVGTGPSGKAEFIPLD